LYPQFPLIQPQEIRFNGKHANGDSSNEDGFNPMISAKPTTWAEVDAQGRLVLPPEVVEQFGLKPGARLRFDTDANNIRLHRPVTHLAKVYIETTNHCNIDCITCMRNVWETGLGTMSAQTFDHILDGIQAISPPPLVFFGGIGEPLVHKHLAEMIARVKALGCRVEMITNGTLLDEKRGRELINAGVDLIWVSMDGARPESYADVRLGAELPTVLENLKRFRRLRRPSHRPTPEIGIAFVAMKRNIADLPELLALGKRLGAVHFRVTNVQPYSSLTKDDILYERTLNDITYTPSPWLRKLYLPKMDINELTAGPLMQALSSGYNVVFAGNNLGSSNDVCNFIESGSIVVGWDGSVSPCIPLLYSHVSYLRGYERASHRHAIGNVNHRELLDMWLDPEYVAYRERVHLFAFAPCTACGGCELSRANETDCFENNSPACGGCLWAQGVIQCP
jgi:MoaA/NifB/PqqE/SkfB family radical SAM enzyme